MNILPHVLKTGIFNTFLYSYGLSLVLVHNIMICIKTFVRSDKCFCNEKIPCIMRHNKIADQHPVMAIPYKNHHTKVYFPVNWQLDPSHIRVDIILLQWSSHQCVTMKTSTSPRLPLIPQSGLPIWKTGSIVLQHKESCIVQIRDQYHNSPRRTRDQ